MTFKNLEEAIAKGEESKFDEYLEIMGTLKEPTRSTFAYLLDIATTLRQNELQDRYQVFGGYAVLPHLIFKYGDRIVLAWRGSSDIDMAGDIEVLNVMKGLYNVKTDVAAPNIPGKRKVRLSTENEAECSVDYLPDKRLGGTETLPILGIEVPVLEPRELILSKLRVKEEKTGRIVGMHRVDIIKLLDILEFRKVDPKAFARSLTLDQKRDLYDVILTSMDMTRNARMGIGPGSEYVDRLRIYLRERV